MIANANRAKGSRVYEIKDFMVVRNAMEAEARRTDEAAHLKMFILSMGGRVS